MDTAVAETAVADKQLKAELRINTALLALVREIKRPQTYVGYSAFVLFGLCKKCQPLVWEGASLVNLLEVHAPWACEMCPDQCAVQAIACTFVTQPCGTVECAPISEKIHSREQVTTSLVCGFLLRRKLLPLGLSKATMPASVFARSQLSATGIAGSM